MKIRANETAEFLKKNFSHYLEDLKNLVRIPSVSFPQFPASELRRSANEVAGLLKKRGLENVKILEIPGAHPYVYGERLKAAGMPTVLLYAHHDVQPLGREKYWLTPPFEPVEKESPQGLRLFGRGAADDKAGIVVHTSAIDAYLKTVGELPVNVKLIIEGEEEIGSNHLNEFLRTYRNELKSDVIVLTDTTNFDCGVPALTVALRGMVALEIEVRALTKTVHSGMWGGPVPDPVMGLSKIIASLVDEKGQIRVPGVLEQVRPMSEPELAEFKRIPFHEQDFRKQSGMIPQAQFLRNDIPPPVQTWRLPSLTVNAMEASSKKQAGNIINDVAWAKVSIRLVADMDPEKVQDQLISYLQSQVPWGLELNITSDACTPPWATDAKGPAFEAAIEALTQGYQKPPYQIGCGGSIPFVKPFAEALGGTPCILIGVEDPYTNAHGENESLLIQDFQSACLSQIYLFFELAKRWKP